jgi:hypothetical protein
MDDAKISGLTAGTPTATDTFPFQRGGTANFSASGSSMGAGTILMPYVAPGTSGNVLTSNGTIWTSAANSAANGWIAVTDTWTYASPSTLTVASGAQTKYSDYCKIMFDQHGVTKKFYGKATANTTLTVYAGTDFVVENTAIYPITNIYYSNAANPIGFPSSFNYTPAITPSVGTYTSIRYLDMYFSVKEKILKLIFSFDGTCNNTPDSFTVSLPISVSVILLVFPCIVNTTMAGRIICNAPSSIIISPLTGTFAAATFQGASGIFECKL